MAFLMKDGTVFTTYGNDVSMTNDSKSVSLLADVIENIKAFSIVRYNLKLICSLLFQMAVIDLFELC